MEGGEGDHLDEGTGGRFELEAEEELQDYMFGAEASTLTGGEVSLRLGWSICQTV